MTDAPAYPFLKGHGTENDFVVLPDPDGSVHGGLDDPAYAARVRALCDRRAGLGADGVLRVVRHDGVEAEWFMDYRNADGSISEMCGNGVRVFGRYLVDHEGVDPTAPLPVLTRDGVKVLGFAGDLVSVDMGVPEVLGDTVVSVEGRSWAAVHVSMGNPHAVAFVDDLDALAMPLAPPGHDPIVYPDGVNVELVVRRGPGHIAMRVHERGSGETRSCGTGACAAMVAAALAGGGGPGSSYDVDLPGGRLVVAWLVSGTVLMTGPAVLVASGSTSM